MKTRKEVLDESRDKVRALRQHITWEYATSRERSIALTKLDECEMWLDRCEPAGSEPDKP